MLQFPKKPYSLLLLLGVILVIISFFTLRVLVDIHLVDTYYVFPFAVLSWTIALVFLVAGIVYELTARFLFSAILTWTHIIWTIVTSLFMMIVIYLASHPEMVVVVPRPLEENGRLNSFHVARSLTNIAVISFFIFVAGQVTFLLNIFLGIYSWFRKKN